MAKIKNFNVPIASATGLIMGLILLLPSFAYAAGMDQIHHHMEWLVGILNSRVARYCGILAVTGFGCLAWAGLLKPRHAIFIILGIVLVFGSAFIAQTLINKSLMAKSLTTNSIIAH